MGVKNKTNGIEVDREKLSSAMGFMVDFYRYHYHSPTTWNYFVDSIKKILEGKMRLKTLTSKSPPEPTEEEVDFSRGLVC